MITTQHRPLLIVRAKRLSVVALLSLSLRTATAQSPDLNWVPIESSIGGLFGPNGAIPTNAAIDDAGNVYATMNTRINGQQADRLAKWDGSNWSVLSGYVETPSGASFALCVNPGGTHLYVGGQIAGGGDKNGPASITNIGRFDIAADVWDVSFDGLSNTVQKCGVDAAGNLFVLGLFDRSVMSNVAMDKLGRWDVNTNTWSTIGGASGASTSDLFVEADGSVILAKLQVERFDAVTGVWSPVGLPFDPGSNVLNILADGQTVYAGGSLTHSSVSDQVFKWDGVQWSQHGTLPGVYWPRDLAIDGNGTLYAIPETLTSGLYARDRTATAWTKIADNPSEVLNELATNIRVATDDMVLLGVFRSINTPASGSVLANNLVRWNGSSFNALLSQGSGTRGQVLVVEPIGDRRRPLVRYDRALAVGGELTQVNNIAVNKIALFDGNLWSPMGLGVTDPSGVVRSITSITPQHIFGTYIIFVGGQFVEVTNKDLTPVAVSNLARYDQINESWQSIGQGVSIGGVPGTGAVHAMTTWSNYTSDLYLYVAGEFDTATNTNGSTVAVRNIARFNLQTNEWEPVAGGVDGVVYALETGNWFFTDVVGSTIQHTVFVGGDFSQALDITGTPVAGTANVARFSSHEDWVPVGRGVGGVVYDLAYRSDQYTNFDPSLSGVLYVGGDFTNVIDGNGPIRPAANLAKWIQGHDRWDVFGPAPLENGINGPVLSVNFQPYESAPFPGPLSLVITGSFTEARNENGPLQVNNAVRLVDDFANAFVFGRPAFAEETFYPFGGGLNAAVNGSATFNCSENTSTYFGGAFTTVGTSPTWRSDFLAHWRKPLANRQVTMVAASSTCSPECAVSIIHSRSQCFSATLSKNTVDPIGTVAFGESVSIDSDLLPIDNVLSFSIEHQGVAYPVSDFVIDTDGAAVLTIIGVADSTQFALNPDGRPTAFAIKSVQVPGKLDPTRPTVRVLNGVTDSPAIDVVLTDGTVLADSVVYGDVGIPIAVPEGDYTARVLRHSDGVELASVALSISNDADARVVLVTGFVDPSANQNGPGIGLLPLAAGTPTSVEFVKSPVPQTLALGAPYPNPFDHSTTFTVDVFERGRARLELFDIAGRRVATILDQTLDAGRYDVHFNGSGLAAGTYLARLLQGGERSTRTVTFVR